MTLEKITMPQLGESVTEGTISKWLVAPGDYVNKYDPLAEVMTDKVNAEIPSSFTGTISELIAKDGETLQVGEVICTIETDREQTNVKQVEGLLNKKSKGATNVGVKNVSDESMKARYSPAVLKMAQEHGIDLTQLTGSGRAGRITRKDLQKLIDSGNIPKAQEKHQSKGTQLADAQRGTPLIELGDVEFPVTAVRKAIASKMVQSKQEIPHAWMMIEVDVTNLVRYRDAVKSEFKRQEGYNLTYFSFFIKAVAQVLKEFPMINSTWAGEKIIQKKEINLSIAVATDDALFVPVIKQADEMSIKGIAKEIHRLAHKVRTGTLSNDEMHGGTFTVNNTGSFGSVQSMGIINYPQAAILQIESIVKRPIIIDGMIAVRDMVNLCLSLDHRVLDGLVCGRFLQRLKEILEEMSEETTSIY